MSKRSEHTFQFRAEEIARAAAEEAEYHEKRERIWREEYEKSIKQVEKTIGAKVVRRDITGGETIDVAIDYGDQAAWKHAQRAFAKIREHAEMSERFRSDEKIYGTQNGRVYELDTDDVHHFRLGNEERVE